jgi:hypothetical protein
MALRRARVALSGPGSAETYAVPFDPDRPGGPRPEPVAGQLDVVFRTSLFDVGFHV